MIRFLPCLFLIGCSVSVPQEGVPVRSAFEEDPEGFHLSIRRDASPLSARPFVPVYYPPDIFPVYVPTRVSRDRDILVGEHWIFMKLNDGGWFPEREGSPRPPPGEADIEELRGLLQRLGETRFDEVTKE